VVRRDVAGALSELGRAARDALPELLTCFQDDADALVRKTALYALVNLVDGRCTTAIPVLQAALRSEDEEVVRAAALALGNIGGPEAVAAVPVLKTTLRDSDVTMKRLSAAALANVGPHAESAVPDLCLALADEDAEVRRNAALALGRIGPKARDAVPVLVRALQPTEPDEDRAVPELLRVLKEDRNPKVRLRAVWVLRYVPDLEGQGVRAAFETALAETDRETQILRYSIAQCLAMRLHGHAPDAVIDVLVAMLTDPSLRIYSQTDTKVNRSGAETQGGQATVTANLAGDGRYIGAMALGEIGPRANRPSVIRGLEEAAQSANKPLRDAAQEALRKIRR
jgi:HEAT repeat protein